MTVPTASTSNSLTFSWHLIPASIIPVASFTLTADEAGPSDQSATVQADMGQYVFENLIEGIEYTYSVRALGENGGISPPIEVSWFTGRDLGKGVTLCTCF